MRQADAMCLTTYLEAEHMVAPPMNGKVVVTGNHFGSSRYWHLYYRGTSANLMASR